MEDRRFCAIALPRVRIEIARASLLDASKQPSDKSEPLAIVIARPGGAVKDERSLLGNTRLDEVSPEAHAMGVRAGSTIAAARAKAANLRVRVVHDAQVVDVLARIAEVALTFGATSAVGTNVVWADITGCAHLHEGGEQALLVHLATRVRALGHACRVGAADGPRVAAAVAWFLASSSPAIVPPGGNAEAMRVLPLQALPLDAETQHWLRRAGMKTVGDLQSLPRRSLGTRLGADARIIMPLLEGDDRAPLVPYVPPEVPEERAELEYGVSSTDALVFVAKRLADGMAARLEGRAMAAMQIELVFGLDRALIEDKPSGEKASPRETLLISLASPLSGAAEILAVLRVRIERCILEAPVLTMTLRVTELATRRADALDLFVAEAKAERALPRLVAELSAEIGDDRVGTLALQSRWLPDDRARLMPLRMGAAHQMKASRFLSSAPEPSRMLSKKIPIDASSMRACATLMRIDAVEWWSPQALTRRDYLRAWLPEHAAIGWVESDPHTGETWLRGWMD